MKTFASSDSLAKVQEVASWLLEMNQELLSVGSKRRRTGGSLRGNPSSSQADEQMNRVVEEEQQQLRQPEEEHTVRNGEVVGADPRPGDQNDSQQGQLEENNNRFISVDEDSSGNQEEPEEDEEHAGEQDEEDEEEEEMDQESDDFDQSDDSSREDEHTHSNSVTNSSSIVDLPIHQLSSPFYTKTTKYHWACSMFSNTNNLWRPESSQWPRATTSPNYVCPTTHRPPGMAENVSELEWTRETACFR